MATTDYNDREHEVCATCGCIVGHGCPDSEPCDCDEPKVVTLDRDAGVGFSATEPVDSSGELPLELDVYGVKGTVYLSQDMWRALGERAGWLVEGE